MWRFLPWPLEKFYDCFLLFMLRRINPDGERRLRFALAKKKVLLRRLKAIDRILNN